MDHVTVDAELAGQFTDSKPVVDATGRVLGMFLTREEAWEQLMKAMAYDAEHETREEALADIAKNGTLTSEEASARIAAALALRRAAG